MYHQDRDRREEGEKKKKKKKKKKKSLTQLRSNQAVQYVGDA